MIKNLTKAFARKLKNPISPKIFQHQLDSKTPKILEKIPHPEETKKSEKLKIAENIQIFSKKAPEEFKLMKSRIHGKDMSKDLQIILRKILSKYKRKDVYDKGKDYMHLYGLLHAREGPCDLDNVKVF